MLLLYFAAIRLVKLGLEHKPGGAEGPMRERICHYHLNNLVADTVDKYWYVKSIRVSKLNSNCNGSGRVSESIRICK